MGCIGLLTLGNWGSGRLSHGGGDGVGRKGGVSWSLLLPRDGGRGGSGGAGSLARAVLARRAFLRGGAVGSHASSADGSIGVVSVRCLLFSTHNLAKPPSPRTPRINTVPVWRCTQPMCWSSVRWRSCLGSPSLIRFVALYRRGFETPDGREWR